ncbi:MAG: MFS transporter, partial [Parafilimonas terrae]|nr:MFS transporter [Parafilimonas terrae]
MFAKRYRFLIAFLLFIAGIINYMDRAALGVAAPFVKQDLNLSPSELGVIFSTFFFGYALFAFVGGQLADRYGPRSVYSWAAASWSVLCMLTGAVTGFAQMFVVRALFGFAEGPMNSTTNRTITT